jgi:hypothetical protein
MDIWEGVHSALWRCVACWTEWLCGEGNIVLYAGVLGVGMNGNLGRGTLCCMSVCWVLDCIDMWGGKHCAVWRCVGCWTEWKCGEGNIVPYAGVLGVGLNVYLGRAKLCCMAVVLQSVNKESCNCIVCVLFHVILAHPLD